ncbi:hypothetical protein GCM10020229_17250 [Kitasatospora albolonga]|uniref:DUF4436 family protein n=1 Tax=Kitasatospora albolonga TaxID=68173 RepID=UPI0031EF1E10
MSPLSAVRRARPARWQFGLLALVVVLLAAGITLYLDERNSRQEPRRLGVEVVGDGVELDMTVQEVDPNAQEVTLYTVLVPHGALATGPESLTFTRPVEVTVNAQTATKLKVEAGQAAQPQAITLGLYGGTPSDYPFDRYKLSASWAASSGGQPVPLEVLFTDADPFFLTKAKDVSEAPSEAVLEAKITRSRSTFILAWFMIATMWALALSVLGGAQVLIRKRSPLVWPALGWMAATLFALIGLRNAATGSPPIGCLMDYVALFWAEGIIAASLVCAVASGLRAEHRAAAAEAGG